MESKVTKEYVDYIFFGIILLKSLFSTCLSICNSSWFHGCRLKNLLSGRILVRNFPRRSRFWNVRGSFTDYSALELTITCIVFQLSTNFQVIFHTNSLLHNQLLRSLSRWCQRRPPTPGERFKLLHIRGRKMTSTWPGTTKPLGMGNRVWKDKTWIALIWKFDVSVWSKFNYLTTLEVTSFFSKDMLLTTY